LGAFIIRKKIVVIGNGMVGYKFCEKLLDKGGASSFSLAVFGEEKRPAYDRVQLTQYFSGRTADELTLADKEWYQERGIDLHLGDKIISIDREKKILTSEAGVSLSYDKIVMATGSLPFVPNVPGIEKQGIFVYRTLDDLDKIIAYAKGKKRAAVIGGGLLGLEAAKAVFDLGLETHVVEFATRLMPRQIDEPGSAILVEKIQSLGVRVHLNKSTKTIEGNGKIEGLAFTDDSRLEVDLLVVSAGIRPRDDLARNCGLEVGARGGVTVNDLLQTSDPDIYCIGEAALHRGMIYGLVAPGYEMADIVASNFMGGEKQFVGGDLSAKLKLMGVDVANFGDAFGETPGSRTVIYRNEKSGIYKRLTLSPFSDFLMGGMLVGDASEYGSLLQIMKNRTTLPANPEDLILGPRGDSEQASGLSPIYLPDSAQICTCNNVTKGEIVKAVRDGVCELGPLKNCTKAGTGCGGCLPMVSDILKGVLESEGKVVLNHLCQHFPHSRQELFQVIKVKGLRSFEATLASEGQGRGCEICKPAVASMLASIWNEMILRHSGEQDTNDRYLANIQQGGTYSIIPRILGGEITPDKLIVLGMVAKKYNLYCKITGGQRIDLLGATVNQLPDIWEELIAAGFESGHAYGKALRTVKSCVGSTWCRFGVQDSTGFAIRVENRYKGLRAPHKIKSACSGCMRECAEAQSKDFGMVATEKGWNLYVAGNGGAKPQHAVLLAADLDEETCLKYIDRFLMYYIHTADRLARTATWFNKLEGGLDKLKQVIIEDSLGICEQLEKDMQVLVDTYQCEWKEVVEDPQLRKRFKHFMNSEESDKTLTWIEERDQKRPANWIVNQSSSEKSMKKLATIGEAV
jgi:nitrite reductase (NADH) large subunit